MIVLFAQSSESIPTPAAIFRFGRVDVVQSDHLKRKVRSIWYWQLGVGIMSEYLKIRAVFQKFLLNRERIFLIDVEAVHREIAQHYIADFELKRFV